MSRDPLGNWGDPSQRGNAQNYCGNNPVNYVDPLGDQGKKRPPIPVTAKVENKETIDTKGKGGLSGATVLDAKFGKDGKPVKNKKGLPRRNNPTRSDPGYRFKFKIRWGDKPKLGDPWSYAGFDLELWVVTIINTKKIEEDPSVIHDRKGDTARHGADDRCPAKLPREKHIVMDREVVEWHEEGHRKDIERLLKKWLDEILDDMWKQGKFGLLPAGKGLEKQRLRERNRKEEEIKKKLLIVLRAHLRSTATHANDKYPSDGTEARANDYARGKCGPDKRLKAKD